MTADVEAQELKLGDLVLVEMRVRKIVDLPSGRLGVFLSHLEEDDIPTEELPVNNCQVRTYGKEQVVEVHL